MKVQACIDNYCYMGSSRVGWLWCGCIGWLIVDEGRFAPRVPYVDSSIAAILLTIFGGKLRSNPKSGCVVETQAGSIVLNEPCSEVKSKYYRVNVSRLDDDTIIMPDITVELARLKPPTIRLSMYGDLIKYVSSRLIKLSMDCLGRILERIYGISLYDCRYNRYGNMLEYMCRTGRGRVVIEGGGRTIALVTPKYVVEITPATESYKIASITRPLEYLANAIGLDGTLISRHVTVTLVEMSLEEERKATERTIAMLLRRSTRQKH